MGKTARVKKSKPKQVYADFFHDILIKIKDNQKNLDKKLEEISELCSGKQSERK